MFQFSGFAHLSVYYVFNIVGCPIQVFTDRIVCANPRNFSQLITPFIASESLGISNDNAGEKPAHRKTKVSTAMLISCGLVGT